MEILATNTTYGPVIIITIILGVILSVLIAVIFDRAKGVGERVLAGAFAIVAVALLITVWLDPAYVTYDAIITDWNVVHEQGYEVIETNGKIVTLRKVDE